MNVKNRLTEIEENFGYHKHYDWRPSLELIRTGISENPNDADLYVRVIYILHNILVEEEYPAEMHERMAALLLEYFNTSYEKFQKNPEYSFFIGKILYISEWYFGLNDDIKPISDRLAFKMQKYAAESEPNNILYKWAYLFSSGGTESSRYLVDKILQDKQIVEWLRSKGFPGVYILDSLKSCTDSN